MTLYMMISWIILTFFMPQLKYQIYQNSFPNWNEKYLCYVHPCVIHRRAQRSTFNTQRLLSFSIRGRNWLIKVEDKVEEKGS